MNNGKIKLVLISITVFAVGFVGAFLGKNSEKTKLGKNLEKSLGLKQDVNTVSKTAVGNECQIQNQEEDNSALFVGCNGFF